MCSRGLRQERTTTFRSPSSCPYFWPGSRACCGAAHGSRVRIKRQAERRAGTTKGSAGRASDEEVFSFDGKTIDFGNLELRTKESTIQLTLMEAKLLRHLIRSKGRTVSRKSILEDVWGLREDTDTRAIDNFIVRLRRYIEEDPAEAATSADGARSRISIRRLASIPLHAQPPERPSRRSTGVTTLERLQAAAVDTERPSGKIDGARNTWDTRGAPP